MHEILVKMRVWVFKKVLSPMCLREVKNIGVFDENNLRISFFFKKNQMFHGWHWRDTDMRYRFVIWKIIFKALMFEVPIRGNILLR